MPFMDDFSKALDEMRATMDQLNSKMMKLEDAVQAHFHINRKLVSSPHTARERDQNVLAGMEKELSK
jgi:hypothetical protein